MKTYYPAESLLASVPIATGPGMNADEADSILISLTRMRHEGPPEARQRARTMLNALRMFQQGDEEEVEEAKEKVDTAVRTITLMTFAALVTGRWGAGKTPFLHQQKAFFRGTFWERMETLRAALEEEIKRVHHVKPSSGWIRKNGGLTICLEAVEWLLTIAKSQGSIWQDGLPFGLAWGIIAKGNGKLPFWAYSELPMATCSGAGSCSVNSQRKGWCYSFKAWRYPDAYARQFLNTLANYADAFLARGEDDRAFKTRHNPTTRKKLKEHFLRRKRRMGPGVRYWPTYIMWLVLFYSIKQRQDGKKTFLRLFVDGDVGDYHKILDWLEMAESCAPGAPALQAWGNGGMGHVEIYGYSKAWADWIKAVRLWKHPLPTNYTINMSNGSIYAKVPKIRKAMEAIPMVRGWFDAVHLKTHIKEFIGKLQGHNFSPTYLDEDAKRRVAQFVEINDIQPTMDLDTLRRLVDHLATKLGITGKRAQELQRLVWPTNATGKRPSREGPAWNEIRQILFSNWVETLKQPSQPIFQKAIKELQVEQEEPFKADGSPSKYLQDKILALHLDEVLWSYQQGGSCPLICGNCFDTMEIPSDPQERAKCFHRCASPPGRLFGRSPSGVGPTIHIGLH